MRASKKERGSRFVQFFSSSIELKTVDKWISQQVSGNDEVFIHDHEYGDDDYCSGGVCSFLLLPDEATVVSVNMFVRDFIEINDLKMVNIRDDKLNFQFCGVPIFYIF